MRRGHYNHTSCATSYPSYMDAPACCNHRDALSGMPLAMAYVPWQEWCHIYDVEKGFCRGTIFEELDLPFHGKGGCNS